MFCILIYEVELKFWFLVLFWSLNNIIITFWLNKEDLTKTIWVRWAWERSDHQWVSTAVTSGQPTSQGPSWSVPQLAWGRMTQVIYLDIRSLIFKCHLNWVRREPELFLVIRVSKPSGWQVTGSSGGGMLHLAQATHCAVHAWKHSWINTVINNPGVMVCSYSENRWWIWNAVLA